MCAMTRSHVCHDSFTCVPGLNMCCRTHSYMCVNAHSLSCVSMLIHSHVNAHSLSSSLSCQCSFTLIFTVLFSSSLPSSLLSLFNTCVGTNTHIHPTTHRHAHARSQINMHMCTGEIPYGRGVEIAYECEGNRMCACECDVRR